MAEFRTKADLRRAIIRTAARAHWRHDRTGLRVIAAAVQDNDGWPSAAMRASTIAFARQQAGPQSGQQSGHYDLLPSSGGAPMPGPATPDATLPGAVDRPLCSAPAGAASLAGTRNCHPGGAAPAFLVQSFHNGGNTYV